MKQSISTLLFTLFVGCAVAQAQTVMKLGKPDMKRGTSTMKALSERKSTRECADRKFSDKDLADLLWAANGVNRKDGKRTAPSAMNRQDIDIYVVNDKGAYLYNAAENQLELVAEGDFRTQVASRQDFVKAFPVSLVLVSDLDRFAKNDEHTRLMAAVDAGCVSQNISLFCAANGLATVVRGTMDDDALRKTLKLNDSQLLLLNQPVGYMK